MNILFLDQSGTPGGAELCLLDIVRPYRQASLVGLLADGPFCSLLEEAQIPVRVFGQQTLAVHKESSWLAGLSSLGVLIPLIRQVADCAADYDLVYANTPKALVVGALACAIARRPLVYHLHDIISADHFSGLNRRLLINLSNRFAKLVIANSKASKAAYLDAGGQARVEVLYNGFEPSNYQINPQLAASLRLELCPSAKFVVGHFSRLSPWKGQHVLLEALANCPADVHALFVGDALFGEQDYVSALHAQVEQQGLAERVSFLGFRSDIPALMSACDVVAHTSTAPEPFGRVIVEAMLTGVPVIAAGAGGATELVAPGETGWLCNPGDTNALVQTILDCRQDDYRQSIAQTAKAWASQQFHLNTINAQLKYYLTSVL